MRNKKIPYQLTLQRILETSVSPTRNTKPSSRILLNPYPYPCTSPTSNLLSNNKNLHAQTLSSHSNSNHTICSSNSSITQQYKCKIANKDNERDRLVGEIERRRIRVYEPVLAWRERLAICTGKGQGKVLNWDFGVKSIDNIFARLCKICLNFAQIKPTSSNFSSSSTTPKSDLQSPNNQPPSKIPQIQPQKYPQNLPQPSQKPLLSPNHQILQILMLQAKGNRKQAILKTFQWVLNWLKSIFLLFSNVISKRYQK